MPASYEGLVFVGCELQEREAGHVAVSLLLNVAGAVLWRLKVPKAEDLIPFASGARKKHGR